MRRLIFIISLSLFFAFLYLGNSDAAIMEDYCVVPPYVIQNVPPNVMIVLDNSGSMFNFSYFDGFNTTTTADDNNCATSTNPCTGFTTPGTYPTYKYYGYFNPDYWYDYQSNRFIPTAPKTGSGLSGARAKAATEWDGNFLNWLTMRRIDIIRKVMTGGKTTKGEGAGYDRLIGEIADCPDRGRYKRIANADLYTPYSGTRKIYVSPSSGTCDGSGSGTSSFSIRNDSGGDDGTGDEGTWNVAVRVPIPVEGVLQSAVGTRARLGLSFYHKNAPTPQGGFVQVTISGGSLSSTVNQINLTRPSANTPLGETLWTMAGYFAQQATIEGGPGPRYQSGDFQINNNVDPYNYGSGGQPRYPTCAKSFVLYITDGEPCADGYLPSTILDYANGKSIFNCGAPGDPDKCPAVSATLPGETFSFPASTFPSCSAGNNVAGIEDVALWAHTTDLRNSPTLGVNNMTGTQSLTLYAVFAFGKGSTLLKYAAINGGFEDTDSPGDPGYNKPDKQSEWDNNNDGEPDTYYEATDGAELEESIKNAFLSILKRASSGTAASVLASGEGQGANLLQAMFYPRRRFGNDVIGWVGSLQNLWYHVDPFFATSSIREDTTVDNILNLANDDILQLYFDNTSQTTKAKLFDDSNGDGIPDSPTPYAIKDFDNLNDPLKYLWEAGKLLWSRDLSVSPRTIYTPCISGTTCVGTTGLTSFSTANAGALAPYLQATDVNGNGSNVEEAEDIVRYIHGEGLTTLKDADGTILIAGIDRDGDGNDDYRSRYATIGSETHVWKLGDILNSTPRIASWLQLNTYDTKYSDTTYKSYIDSADYKSRGMVFTGGNDGMLHAFYLGKLELSGAWKDTATKKAKLSDPSGIGIGKETWAFSPKNALPYLKYIMNPDYCHVYTVDLSPYIFDASINGNPADTRTISSWRTILIGAMRTGGACRGTTTSCTDVSGDGSKDCVNTPVDVSGQSIGYSAYFALDVTDSLAYPDDPAGHPPVLLWEFSDPQLGLATTGPAVVRISAINPVTGNTDKDLNGKWFVVLTSGPTGPISTSDMQFMGRSDQNLRLFVLDLKTGSLLRTIDTGVQYAFAGSMLNSINDSDLDYQDDAVYIGYVKRTSTTPYTWTDGGVGRLVTSESPDQSDATKWMWRTVIDGIGPVTSSIVRLQKNRGCTTSKGGIDVEGCLWLFFGTGRYYYAQETGIDDQSGQRRLYGVKEPCVNSASNTMEIDPGCTITVSGLTDVTSIASVPSETTANSATFSGWHINLDSCTDSSGNPISCTSTSVYYGAERVITDPLATTSGLVFFTSMKPYTDVCAIGGKTFIWAMRYNTGGAGALLKGMALLQVSTASIEQVNLSTAFPPDAAHKGGRRTSEMEGLPPTAQGLSILSPPPPVKRTIHMRER